ncbi:GNAT family N-acetyltransferase [Streptomyces sp. NP-1717]|uniref:GNAT family N-acetyltransferase n=1 Tax=unclassified Streptomyces TaxID=2593676 RepID=UPI001F5DD556|nr:GNAT family N-acetyltransferase [Streptomyces sp. NP-1717]MCI3223894.1 GNAT family N-acetyltransferase [Streptomyces sp. NP-1717]WTA72617.1 GNAT family N-acetyltransferase [Streptomyces sp. NBC_00838]
MTVIVRDFRPADAPAVVRVRRACVPYAVTTEEALHFAVRSANPASKYRLLVAEDGGEVIGTSHVSLAYDSDEPGQSRVNPHVHPDHRGKGVGSAILRTAEEHLAAEGATTVFTWVNDEPASLAFAARRGYSPLRSAHFQRLDLAGAALSGPKLPDGCALTTAADFADDPRPVFEADAEATSDEPGDVGTDLDDYEDWLNHTWNHPCLDRGLSTLVVAGGRVVAFTLVHTDGATTYLSAMTGSLREYRGRGLARAAKTDSLRRARAAGYTDAFTNNDAGNEPMLAVNSRFGYGICASEVRHVRGLV